MSRPLTPRPGGSNALDRAVFDQWPSMAELARDLREPYDAVLSWRRRSSIPARADLALIRAAEARAIDLTLEGLARARAAVAKARHK
ncbi:hypothetical protein [Paracoccus sp. NSM]|uniref:hypothetical protein n=1 Tax=Paracoccus sp. NSM TaxID=3457784 RepID=UPI004035A47F